MSEQNEQIEPAIIVEEQQPEQITPQNVERELVRLAAIRKAAADLRNDIELKTGRLNVMYEQEQRIVSVALRTRDVLGCTSWAVNGRQLVSTKPYVLLKEQLQAVLQNEEEDTFVLETKGENNEPAATLVVRESNLYITLLNADALWDFVERWELVVTPQGVEQIKATHLAKVAELDKILEFCQDEEIQALLQQEAAEIQVYQDAKKAEEAERQKQLSKTRDLIQAQLAGKLKNESPAVADQVSQVLGAVVDAMSASPPEPNNEYEGDDADDDDDEPRIAFVVHVEGEN